jgi:hypothetical protein
MQIVKIVTHHKDQEKAAELFLREGVVAVGWEVVGDFRKKDREEIKSILKRKWKQTEHESAKGASQLLMFRDQVKVGALVFAYKANNKVALVGNIVGEYQYNVRNKVGDQEGDIAYPNQRKVKWWESPRDFDRTFLPRKLSDWVARPGTISVSEYDRKKLYAILQKIPSQETVIKALEIQNEDEIKDYMEKHLDEVESNLTLIERECETSSGPMDFLAKDRRGTHTVIEVKMQADDTTATQIRRYMRSFKNDKRISKVRGIIVAQVFTKIGVDEARELIEHGYQLSLVKCKKKFEFVALS